MQNGIPPDHLTLDPRTVEAYESINNAADRFLLFCKDELQPAGFKPYLALFGLIMAASRMAAAGSIDPKLLHSALEAMYSDALVQQRESGHEH